MALNILRKLKAVYHIIRPPRELSIADKVLNELKGTYGENPMPLKKLLDKSNINFSSEIEVLSYLLDNYETPHNVNACLACKEADAGVLTVKSYPSVVNMDLTSFCNVECRFCKYTNKLGLPHSVVTLEQVKAIKWLKYVRILNYSAGTGETLLNPEFVEICKYIRTTYPHLFINFLSNGKALSGSLLKEIKGMVNQIHVSMNASNEEDYNNVIKNGNWKSFSENMKSLSEFAKESPGTLISASFVMMRWNIDRALDNLEFAYNIGARHVDFFHYFTPHIADYNHNDESVLKEKFPPEQSLYFEKEKSDAMFAKVQKRVDELKISVQIPVPFSLENQYINYGIRSRTQPSPKCIQPWFQLFLLWGIKSKREEATLCCGLASDIGAYFDRDEIATCVGLKAFWNSPVFVGYRRSVNGDNINPVCKACRVTDRFNPDYKLVDQSLFFKHQGLPVPEHFTKTSQK